MKDHTATMNTSDELECWTARIHGRVQGVGFRDSTARKARQLGIRGWVRNRADGSVEALLLGPPEAIRPMKDWLKHGPSSARVDTLDLQPVAPPFPVVEGFEQRPTA